MHEKKGGAKKKRHGARPKKNAVVRLAQARNTAVHSGAAERPLINLGGNMYCLLPWLGTYSFYALERFLRIRCAGSLGLRAFDSARPFYMQFTMQAGEKEFFAVLTEEIQKPLDPMELIYPKELPLFDKYDEYLPPDLVKKGFACGVLNIEEMKQRIDEWTKIFINK